MLSVRDVATKLGVSSALIYALVAEGKLVCYRIGLGRGAIRFNDADVDAYLASCRVEGEERMPCPPSPRLKHLKF